MKRTRDFVELLANLRYRVSKHLLFDSFDCTTPPINVHLYTTHAMAIRE